MKEYTVYLSARVAPTIVGFLQTQGIESHTEPISDEEILYCKLIFTCHQSMHYSVSYTIDAMLRLLAS